MFGVVGYAPKIVCYPLPPILIAGLLAKGSFAMAARGAGLAKDAIELAGPEIPIFLAVVANELTSGMGDLTSFTDLVGSLAPSATPKNEVTGALGFSGASYYF